MKTRLILTGKTQDKRIASLTDDYVARLSHYIPFETLVIPDLRQTKSLSEAQQKQAEGEAILRNVRAEDFLVVLDERGKEMRSMEMARWLQKKLNQGRSLTFVVGGPYGFSEDVYARADEAVSLSKMTFSHQMVRLVFAEQLYRACTILRGEPYHHE